MGIKGLIHFGYRLEVQLIKNKPVTYPYIHPRSITLSVALPNPDDCEKNIAILHPNIIKLLGISEGDYITLEAINSNRNRENYINLFRIRAFSGIANEIKSTKKTGSYPYTDHIHLDEHTRRKLGIKKGMPVLIKADIKNLVFVRLLFYVTSLLIAVISLAGTLEAFFRFINHPGYGSVAAILLAIILTCTLALYDIKSKVNH